MPAEEEMPSTIRRSPKKAQEVWPKDELGESIDCAHEQATGKARER